MDNDLVKNQNYLKHLLLLFTIILNIIIINNNMFTNWIDNYYNSKIKK